MKISGRSRRKTEQSWKKSSLFHCAFNKLTYIIMGPFFSKNSKVITLKLNKLKFIKSILKIKSHINVINYSTNNCLLIMHLLKIYGIRLTKVQSTSLGTVTCHPKGSLQRFDVVIKLCEVLPFWMK